MTSPPSTARNLGRLAVRLAVGIGVIVALVVLNQESDPAGGVANTPTLSRDDVFVATVESRGLVVTDRAALTEGGRAVCSAIDDGAPPATLAAALAGRSGLGFADAGYAVGAAVGTYCPEHRSQLSS